MEKLTRSLHDALRKVSEHPGETLHWMKPSTLRALERRGLIACVDRAYATNGATLTDAGRAALASK